MKADRQAGRQKGRRTDRQTGIHTDRGKKQTDRQADTQGKTAKQTKETDKTDRTEKQAADKTGRETDTWKVILQQIRNKEQEQEHRLNIFHGEKIRTGIGRKSMRSGKVNPGAEHGEKSARKVI